MDTKINPVHRLRSFEPVCYTICLHLLLEEQKALLAAERLLIALYQDERFRQLEEKEIDRYILRKAWPICCEMTEPECYMKTS
ncbi:hypothetical protein [Paenibacillus sp. NPDC058071]|uniref:hypothetical protein n=1 Tax=Paenibacillus sp. NPDC058071 TaxID=3346326 RepID=UPI0036DA5BD6